MQRILLLFIISFFVALLLSPICLRVLRRLKAGQTILHYVDFHQKKNGTPTMGGFVFILPLVVITPFIINGKNPMSLIIVLASLGFGILGFLDDFIKVKGGKNLGLRAYQKIVGQGGIAVLVSIFYYMSNTEGRIFIPFANNFVDIGFWIAPLLFFALVAATNSVNLTDGLDGLAGSVTFIYLVFISVIMLMFARFNQVQEVTEFVQIAAVTCGGLLCFLMFNSNKASVFMGDTGSLYLGSLVALISFFSYMGLFLVVLGVMFVVSSVSDILQVAYFKWTKRKSGTGKRIFLMAPFHHHLEKKGWAEAKIVAVYCAITILAGMVCVLSLL